MEIVTPQLGSIKYQEKEIITFPDGLYGFEHLKKFLFISDKQDTIFFYLQSIDDVDITFILARPKDIVKNYVLMISKVDMAKIKAENELDLQDYVIITIPKDVENISANLLGPVVINERLNIAAQLISKNTEYSTKHKILDQVQSKVS